MKAFAWGVLAGIIAVIGGLAGTYAVVAVFWPSSLPAPALTTMVQFDEKLRFIRNNPGLNPRIIAVGSSITWRQIAGSEFETIAGGPNHFVNAGTSNLQIHQSRRIVLFYLDNFPNVQTVLLMVGLPDFKDCADTTADMFDMEDATAYVFHRWPTAYFYLRYFAPQRYARTALTLARRRAPFSGDLFLDRYGSGPLEVSKAKQRGLRYGEIKPDPACITSLIQLSHELSARGVNLMIVFPPVHPRYRRTYPNVDRWTRETGLRVEAETKADRTKVVLMQDDARFAAADFYDAFHLQWDGVQRLSVLIAREVERFIAGEKARGSKIVMPSVLKSF